MPGTRNFRCLVNLLISWEQRNWVFICCFKTQDKRNDTIGELRLTVLSGPGGRVSGWMYSRSWQIPRPVLSIHSDYHTVRGNYPRFLSKAPIFVGCHWAVSCWVLNIQSSSYISSRQVLSIIFLWHRKAVIHNNKLSECRDPCKAKSVRILPAAKLR